MMLCDGGSILHRVMPSHAERFCITIWLDGLDVNRYERHAFTYIPHVWKTGICWKRHITMSGRDMTSMMPHEAWGHLASTRDNSLFEMLYHNLKA